MRVEHTIYSSTHTSRRFYCIFVPRSRSRNIVFRVGSLHGLSEATTPPPPSLLLRLIFYCYNLSQILFHPTFIFCLSPRSNPQLLYINTPPNKVAPLQRMIPPLTTEDQTLKYLTNTTKKATLPYHTLPRQLSTK